MSKQIRHLIGLLLVLAVLVVPALALAQSGGGYDLTWNTIDGGGYTFSTGGGYSLGGTIGQADAGAMTGGAFTLAGGFWGGGEVQAIQYHIYLPLVLRNRETPTSENRLIAQAKCATTLPQTEKRLVAKEAEAAYTGALSLHQRLGWQSLTTDGLAGLGR